MFSKIKATLVENMSKLQIESQERIFVLNSVLALTKNIPPIIKTWDISRYFDQHTLLEAHGSWCQLNATE